VATTFRILRENRQNYPLGIIIESLSDDAMMMPTFGHRPNGLSGVTGKFCTADEQRSHVVVVGKTR
jgi:hypothetical protein